MDVQRGNLRLVTTDYRNAYRNYKDPVCEFVNFRDDESVNSNSPYLLDSARQPVSALTGLAPDERIYSARFLGDVVYFVTFHETDHPLQWISKIRRNQSS